MTTRFILVLVEKLLFFESIKGTWRDAGAGLFFLSVKRCPSDLYYKADEVPCHGEAERNDAGSDSITPVCTQRQEPEAGWEGLEVNEGSI